MPKGWTPLLEHNPVLTARDVTFVIVASPVLTAMQYLVPGTPPRCHSSTELLKQALSLSDRGLFEDIKEQGAHLGSLWGFAMFPAQTG